MTGAAVTRIDTRLAALWLSFSFCWVGISCAGSQERDALREQGRDAGQEEPLQPGVEALTGAIARPDLLDLLGRSAGDFLRHVVIEHELRDGVFSGWRIESLPQSTPSWLDVQRGDVVTAVNGMPVERPEDAQSIWEVLQVASEVRIDLLRAGERRSVRIPVEDVTEEGGGGTGDAAPGPDPDLQPAPAGPTE